ncbi:MAG: SDR family NAD(P)-dependent oxidoreductase, partial [Alphaproteobacteria bacterium]
EKAEAGICGWVALDVTEPASVEQAVAQVLEASGRLDGVVNNAGIGMMGALGDTTEEELMRVFHTNVVGLHTVSRVAAPHLNSSKGHLIQIGSRQLALLGPRPRDGLAPGRLQNGDQRQSPFSCCARQRNLPWIQGCL